MKVISLEIDIATKDSLVFGIVICLLFATGLRVGNAALTRRTMLPTLYTGRSQCIA